MPDAYSFGRGGSGPTNITPPMPGTGNGGLAQALLGARFGGMGPGLGFGARYGGGVRRKPGLDPYADPSLKDLGGGVGPGGEVYDPESFYSPNGRGAVRATWTGGQVNEPVYDAQGRLIRNKKVDAAPGDWGVHNPNASMSQLRGYSAALGGWRNRPGSSGGIGQGAGFGQPDDVIRKLLMARMGGGM